MSAEPGAAADNLTYIYRPSLLGAPWEFKLNDTGVEWTAGRRSGRVDFAKVRRLRMSYRPANMQMQRFVTEIWADGAPKLQIASSSWKSMFEQERLDKPYSDFIGELHRRIALAGAAAEFVQGSHPLLYWPGLAVFIGVGLALLLLVLRALQAGAIGGAIFIIAFFALFLWQGGNFFRRNRPGVYRPDEPPPLLVPRH